jgi:hypothetical protein
MGKENKATTDNLGWIKALLFPQKSKPITTLPPAKFEAPATPQQTPPGQPQPARVTLTKPATSASLTPSNLSQPTQQPDPVTAPDNTPPSAPEEKFEEPAPIQTEPPPPATPKKRNFLPAFWTVASVLSLIVNVILIIILLILGRELFTLKALVGDQLLGGLYNNFVLMDEAHIKTTILVETEIPVQFTLPVVTDTTVQLTEDTRIDGARVTLSTGGLNIISAPTNIILPAGTNLPIALNITVPVDTTIPIVLEVPVDIPLNETELHEPFVGLQDVVGPYYKMLDDLPNAQEIPLCKSATWLCRIFFRID